jgi:hypothetical protein
MYITVPHTIARIESGSTTASIIVGAGTSGNVDGTGDAVRLNQPNGITVAYLNPEDTTGYLYFADMANHRIKRLTPHTREVITIAGGGSITTPLRDSTGLAARFNQPRGITVNTDGDLLITEVGNHTVRKMTLPKIDPDFLRRLPRKNTGLQPAFPLTRNSFLTIKWDEATFYKYPFDRIAGTGDGAWNTGFISQTVTGPCYVTFRPGQTNADFVVGLAYNPTAGFDRAGITFGIELNPDATSDVIESGVSRGKFGGTYQTNDTFTVLYDGTRVQYMKNSRVIYTSTTVPTGAALGADASLFTDGTIVKNVFFGSLPSCS